MTQIQSMEKNLIRLKTAWKRCRATKKTQNNNKEIKKKKKETQYDHKQIQNYLKEKPIKITLKVFKNLVLVQSYSMMGPDFDYRPVRKLNFVFWIIQRWAYNTSVLELDSAK